jgi:hypothetical protein
VNGEHRADRAGPTHLLSSPHWVLGVLGKHPKSLGVQHHDRRMVTYPRGHLVLLLDPNAFENDWRIIDHPFDAVKVV